MKNALNNQVGMLGNMFLCLVANLKQWQFTYLVKQACGNDILASVQLPLETALQETPPKKIDCT